VKVVIVLACRIHALDCPAYMCDFPYMMQLCFCEAHLFCV
jgi:hypothetical protein